MAKEVRIRRESVYWHFDKSGKRNLDKPGNGDGHDDDMGGGRVTRSSVAEEDEDWTIDMDAANCEVTQIRRLDRYLETNQNDLNRLDSDLEAFTKQKHDLDTQTSRSRKVDDEKKSCCCENRIDMIGGY